MGYMLEVLQGPEAGRQIHLTSNEIVIGRDGQYANVVLSDPRLSRAHARLFCRNDAWYVVDMGGSGTYVNRGPVGASPVQIQPGDVIQLGDSMLRMAFAPGTALAPVAIHDPSIVTQQVVQPTHWPSPHGSSPQQQHNIQVTVSSNNNLGLVAIAIALVVLGLGPCGILCFGLAILAMLPWLMLAGGIALAAYGGILLVADTGLPGDSRGRNGRALLWTGIVLAASGLALAIWLTAASSASAGG